MQFAPAGAAGAYAPAPALVAAVGKKDQVAFCAGREKLSVPAYVRKWYSFATTSLANGTTIYTAAGGGPCLDGAANIGLFAYIAGRGTDRFAQQRIDEATGELEPWRPTREDF